MLFPNAPKRFKDAIIKTKQKLKLSEEEAVKDIICFLLLTDYKFKQWSLQNKSWEKQFIMLMKELEATVATNFHVELFLSIQKLANILYTWYGKQLDKGVDEKTKFLATEMVVWLAKQMPDNYLSNLNN